MRLSISMSWMIPLIFMLTAYVRTEPASAQFGGIFTLREVPEAKTKEELDDFLQIYESEKPEESVKLVNRFMDRYPNSQFGGIALQYQMRAFQSLNDLVGTISAGERILQAQPQNVDSLVVLAKTIPALVPADRPNDPQLERAALYAVRAMKELSTFHIPRTILPDRWDLIRKAKEAEIHEAMGYIAAKRGRLSQAVQELKTAVRINPKPEGSQYFRLAVIYEMSGQFKQSVKAYQQARFLGPPKLAAAAHDALTRLKKDAASK